MKVCKAVNFKGARFKMIQAPLIPVMWKVARSVGLFSGQGCVTALLWQLLRCPVTSHVPEAASAGRASPRCPCPCPRPFLPLAHGMLYPAERAPSSGSTGTRPAAPGAPLPSPPLPQRLQCPLELCPVSRAAPQLGFPVTATSLHKSFPTYPRNPRPLACTWTC